MIRQPDLKWKSGWSRKSYTLKSVFSIGFGLQKKKLCWIRVIIELIINFYNEGFSELTLNHCTRAVRSVWSTDSITPYTSGGGFFSVTKSPGKNSRSSRVCTG